MLESINTNTFIKKNLINFVELLPNNEIYLIQDNIKYDNAKQYFWWFTQHLKLLFDKYRLLSINDISGINHIYDIKSHFINHLAYNIKKIYSHELTLTAKKNMKILTNFTIYLSSVIYERHSTNEIFNIDFKINIVKNIIEPIFKSFFFDDQSVHEYNCIISMIKLFTCISNVHKKNAIIDFINIINFQYFVNIYSLQYKSFANFLLIYDYEPYDRRILTI